MLQINRNAFYRNFVIIRDFEITKILFCSTISFSIGLWFTDDIVDSQYISHFCY